MVYALAAAFVEDSLFVETPVDGVHCDRNWSSFQCGRHGRTGNRSRETSDFIGAVALLAILVFAYVRVRSL